MDLRDWLRVLFLSLVLAAVVAMRWWPGLTHRKFDWRLFKSSGKKKK